MNRTRIPWADWTWNPVAGCSPMSAGCANCYAARMARRFGMTWGHPVFHPLRLVDPVRRARPGRVFVCSMGDLGHPSVPPSWRREVAAAMESAPWHTFMVLTKRPGTWLRELPESCWVGVSIESQAETWRWGALLAGALRESPVRFVSVEPMLGPVSLAEYAARTPGMRMPDWVIAGPETGPGARRCEDGWIEELAAESRCFFDKREREGVRREWPDSMDETESRANNVLTGGEPAAGEPYSGATGSRSSS